MPKLTRGGSVPEELLDHVLDRVFRRQFTSEDLMQVLYWVEKNPDVPNGEWFKRIGKVTVCGEGALIKTFLSQKQTAKGEEVE